MTHPHAHSARGLTTFGAVRRTLTGFAAAIARIRRQHRDRLLLETMDARMLNDIGLLPTDIRRAVRTGRTG